MSFMQKTIYIFSSGVVTSGVYLVDNSRFTLDQILADDNGAYKYKGSPCSYVYYNGIECKKAHLKNESWFIKRRIGRKYVDECVDKQKIFALIRGYRVHNTQKGFSNTVCRVKSIETGCFLKFCLVINEWTENEVTDPDFQISCHGNSKKENSRSTPYLRTEKNVLLKMEEKVKNGERAQIVYDNAIEESGGPFNCISSSTQPRNPKQVCFSHGQAKNLIFIF